MGLGAKLRSVFMLHHLSNVSGRPKDTITFSPQGLANYLNYSQIKVLFELFADSREKVAKHNSCWTSGVMMLVCYYSSVGNCYRILSSFNFDLFWSFSCWRWIHSCRWHKKHFASTLMQFLMSSLDVRMWREGPFVLWGRDCSLILGFWPSIF